jgi:hypothetical protein
MTARNKVIADFNFTSAMPRPVVDGNIGKKQSRKAEQAAA